MHAELVVPGLFASEGAARYSALEILLARGRRRSAPAQRVEEWIQQAFELDGMPAGALTLLACGGNPGESSWMRADPVHLQLMREHVIVVPGEALNISAEESGALCEALNRHFPDLNATACTPRHWCARAAEDLSLNAGPALDAAGREVRAPREAPRLLNEAQMLLYAHPVNEAREARGEPAVNSLWLWGAGPLPASARSSWQSVAADDRLVLGAARLAGARHRALPRSATEWIERLPEDGRHLAVLDGALENLEKQWFAPLLAALRSGRIGMVSVHVPDAAEAVSFETIRADLRRFWRRAKPIENYA